MGASFVTDQRCRYGSEVFDTWGKTAVTARDRWSSTGAINGWGRQERPLLVSTAAESLVAVLLDALGVDLLLASAPGGGGAGRGERRDFASAPEGKICDKS